MGADGDLRDETHEPVHREIRTLLQKVGTEAGVDPRWIAATILHDGTIEQPRAGVDALVLSGRSPPR